MKMIAGAASLACANRSRTRLAPTPTIISMNSERRDEKNGTPASPATARASSVLPVPGGPASSTPLGTRAPSRRVLLGVFEEVDDLGQLVLGLVDAGHVGEGDRALARLVALGPRPPEGAQRRPRAGRGGRRMNSPTSRMVGPKPSSSCSQNGGAESVGAR